MPCLTTIPLDVKKVSCHSCKNWRENNKGFSVGNKCPPRMTCESSEAEKGVQNAWTIGAQEKARKYTLPVASDCDDTSILSEKILPRWIFTEMSVQFFNSVPWAFFWAINNIWTFGFASTFHTFLLTLIMVGSDESLGLVLTLEQNSNWIQLECTWNPTVPWERSLQELGNEPQLHMSVR